MKAEDLFAASTVILMIFGIIVALHTVLKPKQETIPPVKEEVWCYVTTIETAGSAIQKPVTDLNSYKIQKNDNVFDVYQKCLQK